MPYELTFQLPYTELHPYYKKLIQFMRKHNWCMLDAEALEDPIFNSAHQIEAFRCAVREMSNERDREVIIDEVTAAPNILFELAEKGRAGSLPEVWDEKDEAVANALAGEKKPKLIV